MVIEVGEPPPPQLIVNIAAKMQRLSSKHRLSLRCAWPPTKKKPKARIPAATGQLDRLCGIGGTSTDACAAALMVSVAVAWLFTVTVDGLRLQVIWLEEGAQVKATAPLNSFCGARLMATVAELPGCIVICGNCGAMMKSGDTLVDTTFSWMGALTDN
jgi:hypothetical protein